MQRVIFYLIVFITSTVLAQKEEELAVKNTINTFFEGFHKRDTTLMKSVMSDNIILQTAYKVRDKSRKDILRTETVDVLINSVANREGSDKWEERLLSYNIQIDGNMAHVWTPYEFWFNDSFNHCGVNSFQLFKDADIWKIIYIIDTRRRIGCDAN